MSTKQLVVNRDGKPYFDGDLRAGKRVANEHTYVRLTQGEAPQTGDLVCIVELYDSGALVADGQSAEDYEQAWRFALGSFFGAWDRNLDPGMSLSEQLARAGGEVA